jgi:predicted adenylyl cyclase CyaB
MRIGKLIRINRKDLDAFKEGANRITENTEIELRYRIDNVGDIQKRLIDQKAVLIQQAHLIDHWFVTIGVKNIAEEIVWFDVKRNTAIRIRESIDDYGKHTQTTLETKRMTSAMNHDTFLETAMLIENYEKAKEFLEMIDRKEYLTIDKNRLIYKIFDFKVCIDVIKDYGVGLEIEYSGTENNREKIISEIQKIAQLIGLDETMRFEKSITADAMITLARF